MTLPPDWTACLSLIARLIVAAGLVIALAAALTRFLESMLWQRTIWQAAFVSVLLITLVQVTGFDQDLAGLGRAALKTSQDAPPVGSSFKTPNTDSRSITAEFRNQVAERIAAHRQSEAGSSGSKLQQGHPSPSAVVGPTISIDVEPYLQGPSMPWPELAWVLGMCAVLGPTWLARLFFFWFRPGRRPCFDGALLQRTAQIARQLGIQRPVRVFESRILAGPIAFGILRPTIEIPENFPKVFSVAQQEVMLAHELAHLAGHDPAWQMLADLVAALLWWHPLVWWARRRLRAAAESAADEASVLVNGGPAVLAECLFQLASRVNPARVGGYMNITGPGLRSGLAQRIKRLLELKRQTWTPAHWIHTGTIRTLVPLILVAAIIFCTAWANPQPTWKGERMKTIAQTWKRSIATLALFATFGVTQGDSQVSPGPSAITKAEPEQTSDRLAEKLDIGTDSKATPIPTAGSLLQEAKALLDTGKLDEAEAKVKEALKIAPQNKKAQRYLNQIGERRAAAENGKTDPAVQTNPSEDDAQSVVDRYRMDPRLAARYGLLIKPATDPSTPAVNAGEDTSAARSASSRYQMDPRLAARYGLLPPQPAANPATADTASATGPTTQTPQPLLQRYGRYGQGYGPGGYGQPGSATGDGRTEVVTATSPSASQQSRGKQQVEAKLNRFVLSEALYDGLPLSEVLRDLNEQSRRRDPDHKGINFLVTSTPATISFGGIDPVTGNPIQPTTMDLNSTTIRVHLRDVSMRELLDAMVRVAEVPINYSIEDYGVVFGPVADTTRALPTRFAQKQEEPVRLQVRTFKVDTNTFLAGLENAFGITVTDKERTTSSPDPRRKALANKAAQLEQLQDKAHAEPSPSSQNPKSIKEELERTKAEFELEGSRPSNALPAATRNVQLALRELLQELGVNMDVSNKAVFYNDLTGILMVRATTEELEVVQAAIETLGGKLLPRVSANALLDHAGTENSVSVMGKVNRGGIVAIPSDRPIDLLEAIARAGDFSPIANRNKIQLTRDGKTIYYKFDELVKRGANHTVLCEPGDVIFVHETVF